MDQRRRRLALAGSDEISLLDAADSALDGVVRASASRVVPAALSVVFVFLIEGVVPFFYFAPRKLRTVACWITIFFQLLILITGNFGFFNVLAIVLCVTLLDDAQLRITRTICIPSPWYRRQRALLLAPVIALILVISTVQFFATVGWRTPMQRTFPYLRYTEGWYAVNPYGLFAIMTTTRPEIISGSSWRRANVSERVRQPIQTRARSNRRPAWFVPHMPRLDWQMWFAALGDINSNP